ncbi:Uu.00g035330.m01.CDS01 [Anthostomella pinea]|uniref:Uu.00g035330.m01.CDS01 n=1 Tax=Anthostomella pinea TaxID=933095 RepID=A0AAI8VA78_9PEZI|nr:Uu.00g035330.m01.CDS01 [Anthostomella pinea]
MAVISDDTVDATTCEIPVSIETCGFVSNGALCGEYLRAGEDLDAVDPYIRTLIRSTWTLQPCSKDTKQRYTAEKAHVEAEGQILDVIVGVVFAMYALAWIMACCCACRHSSKKQKPTDVEAGASTGAPEVAARETTSASSTQEEENPPSYTQYESLELQKVAKWREYVSHGPAKSCCH